MAPKRVSPKKAAKPAAAKVPAAKAAPKTPAKTPASKAPKTTAAGAPEATEQAQGLSFCYKHQKNCFQDGTHPRDCNPCCFGDKCGKEGIYPRETCSGCTAKFHKSCQVESRKAQGLDKPAEGDSVCDACRSVAQQHVDAEAALVRQQALAQAQAQKPSGAPPPAESEPPSEYVPLEGSCAYAKVEAGAQDESLPLQTYCTCTHAEEPPWRPCKHEGCANKFHDLCCATTSFSYGLRNTPLDSETMFCPEHHMELKTQHLKQLIQIKYMTKDRDAYLAKKSTESTADTDKLEAVPMRVLGVIADVDLATLCGSIPVSEGGFAQRNVASQHASSIEESIRTDGYMLLAGNLALAELPYSEEEIKELQENKLLSEDFVPPQPLCDMKMQTRVGAWLLNFHDPALRMRGRRFAIIDGNNRVIAIVRISAGDPGFLKNTPLNAYLVDLPVHDGLAVQLASMRCNRLSHQNIEDTIGDTIQQYKNVIRVYEKLNPPKEDPKQKRARNHKTGSLTS